LLFAKKTHLFLDTHQLPQAGDSMPIENGTGKKKVTMEATGECPGKLSQIPQKPEKNSSLTKLKKLSGR
jgi:hypothetical protein